MLGVVIVLVCTLAISGVHGRIAIGACPSVTTKSDMDFSQFIGNWFEVSRYPSLNQARTKCNFYFLNLQQSNTVVRFDINSIDIDTESTFQIQFDFAISGTSGALTRTDASDVTVLETDNTNYAVLYSCEVVATLTESRTLRREFLWVLSRTDSGLDQASTTAVSSVISSNGLSEDPLVSVSQEGCE